ncbi:hypothetical protein FJ251_02075 [bacterium]|nr:hypothetical protein [bacterium]
MRSDDAGLWAILGAFLFSILLMAGLLTLAQREYVRGLRERQLVGVQTRLGAEALLVVRVGAGAALGDPEAKLWREAPATQIALLPQNVALPAITETAVASIALQAVTDGERIAFRLSWPDATRDRAQEVTRFGDAAALQFPLAEDATYMMGAAGKRVQILHWKALWQRDVDEGFQDVQDLHPNYWVDLYWFAAGSFPQRVPEDFADTRAQAWFPARAAGNPIAQWNRVEPIEELIAEGFGTLTAQRESASAGRAVWREGRWWLTVVRPLETQDPNDYQFRLDRPGSVGVAIWDGSAGNVGGRKQYSPWLRFEVQG